MGLISQLSNGTMEVLRLPLPFFFSSLSLDWNTTCGTPLILNILSSGCTYSTDLDCFYSGNPYFPILVWRQEALPCSHACLMFL